MVMLELEGTKTRAGSDHTRVVLLGKANAYRVKAKALCCWVQKMPLNNSVEKTTNERGKNGLWIGTSSSAYSSVISDIRDTKLREISCLSTCKAWLMVDFGCKNACPQIVPTKRMKPLCVFCAPMVWRSSVMLHEDCTRANESVYARADCCAYASNALWGVWTTLRGTENREHVCSKGKSKFALNKVIDTRECYI